MYSIYMKIKDTQQVFLACTFKLCMCVKFWTGVSHCSVRNFNFISPYPSRALESSMMGQTKK